MSRELQERVLKIQEKKDNNDITVELISSMTLIFAENLPHSIDPLSNKFVPSMLYNVIPKDAKDYWCFKYEEFPTLFKVLKEWGDTRKTAYSLMVCGILQNMLLGGNCELSKEESDSIKIWGLSEKDSKIMKDTILLLPDYCDKIQSSKTIYEREKNLCEAYESIKKNFGAWKPHADLNMYYYFHNINFKRYTLESSEYLYERNVLNQKKYQKLITYNDR